jgi:NDP-4-keto-2,6-dideoxyhexose 3-C-methyltransferase
MEPTGDSTNAQGFTKTDKCRLCGGSDLQSVLDLGHQALSGRFPGAEEPDPLSAPLELVLCGNCALVQLGHSVSASELYTYGYGYRSGLNATMCDHLGELVKWTCARVPLKSGDIVLDIGCNDGTLLGSYNTPGLRRIGIDPIADKFAEHHPPEIEAHEGFFSKAACQATLGAEKAKVITSIAMFYDLENPAEFVATIAQNLDPDGIWVLEQSYLPTMLETNAFDTVCHEHLEYYALRQIEHLARDQGLRVFDVVLNQANGGSFRLAVCHADGPYADNSDALNELRAQEDSEGLDTPEPYERFARRIEKIRDDLVALIKSETAKGRSFYLYGASTKGNTLLQYCAIDHHMITAAAEVNSEKWGLRTPRTAIPIVSEAEARAAKPDYFLVLPWHFHDAFVAREADFIADGGRLLFPLPQIEIVGGD